jgi:gentisate 1,2-dioxygenase
MLGTLEDLPLDYREALTAAELAPLWPQMRNLLPHGKPASAVDPHVWRFETLRPLLLRAGQLTPVEKAERRVLVLCDPGRAGALQATATIYAGMQLLLPGEAAPSHRHTPSAARILVEGTGGYTVVDGKKCVMEKGDLILTPGGMWHDHGHDGGEPVIWLDALDLPLLVMVEASFAEEGHARAPDNEPDPALTAYREAGLVPTRAPRTARPDYPMLRYPFARVRAALDGFAVRTNPGAATELDYVNPETGDPCLPTLGFTAMRLAGGETIRATTSSASAVFHVVAGHGRSFVDGRELDWREADSFSAPPFAEIFHEAEGDAAYLIRIHDRPLQEKLRFYSERPLTSPR